MTPDAIRTALRDQSGQRPRDLADSLGISEAQIVAAQVGDGVTRIACDPDTLIPRVCDLGHVMALTRNRSCVIEKDGTYRDYRGGGHATMVFSHDIDLRFFPKHFVHGFACDLNGHRSLQVFDAAGDAVHKIYAREGTDMAAWEALVTALATSDQSDTVATAPRIPPEPARPAPGKVDILRQEWARMTDTHQFLRLVSKLGMNRLGAYRIAGAPFVRPLAPGAFDLALQHAARDGTPIMLFVGNQGCIEIHTGPIHTLKRMGPWQNVLDEGFNLHLRADHIAETWAVDKPTRRGTARSIECFDADGALIAQMFGVRNDRWDSHDDFSALIDALPAA